MAGPKREGHPGCSAAATALLAAAARLGRPPRRRRPGPAGRSPCSAASPTAPAPTSTPASWPSRSAAPSASRSWWTTAPAPAATSPPRLVAKARPDGYLFLIGTAGTHAINADALPQPALRPAARRDPRHPAGRRAERAAGQPGEAAAIPDLPRPGGGGAGPAGGAELCLDRQWRLDPPGRRAIRRRGGDRPGARALSRPARRDPGAARRRRGPVLQPGRPVDRAGAAGPGAGAGRDGAAAGRRPCPACRRWPRPAACRASRAAPGTGCSARPACRPPSSSG